MALEYEVVIPARNEGPTIGAVVRAACGSGAAGVVVVDDHSTDDTARVAADAGARVVRSGGRASKALALATGFAATTAPAVVFFDADILGAAPAHFDALATPVTGGGFAMSCGLVDYGLRNALFLRLPPITGLRAVRREVFAAIGPERLNGFQIEIMINEVVARGGMRSTIQVLKGLAHRSKLQKLGPIRGLRANVSMTAELLHCLTFVPLWTYPSYLRHLTIQR